MAFPLIDPQPSWPDAALGTIEFRDPNTDLFIDSYPTADDADAQTNPNANPLTLDSNGSPTAGVFLEDGVSYKVEVKDEFGASKWVHDDVQSPAPLGNITQGIVGAALWPRTAEEIAAGLLEINLNTAFIVSNIKRTGAIGNRIADDGPRIQETVDTLSELGGGLAYVPYGQYLCTTPVVGKKNVGFIGDGWGSILVNNGGQNGAVDWDETEAENVMLHNFAVDVNSAGDFATGLQIDAPLTDNVGGPAHISRMKFFDSNKASQGDWTVQGILCRGISDLFFIHNFLDGCQAKLNGGSGVARRLNILGNIVKDPSAYGISVTGSSNALMEIVNILGNIVFNPQRGCIFAGQDGAGHTGVTTKHFNISNNVAVDGDRLLLATRANINFEHGATSAGLKIKDNLCAGFDNGGGVITASGIDISQANSGVGSDLSGNTLIGPYDGRGMVSSGEKSCKRDNNTFINCKRSIVDNGGTSGSASHNTVDGLGIAAGRMEFNDADDMNIDFNEFADCVIGAFDGVIDLESTVGNTTKAKVRWNTTRDTFGTFDHAVHAPNGGSFDIEIAENDFRELASTVFSGSSDVVDINILRRNRGYVTENSGTGSIASGTTSDVIAHGLSVTPTIDQISITLAENPTNTPGAIWVDTIGGTNFTVNCENDPGVSNLDFGWRVDT